MTLKGRVAATIQSSDELVLTELIFNSGFKVRPVVPHTCIASSLTCCRIDQGDMMQKGHAHSGWSGMCY